MGDKLYLFLGTHLLMLINRWFSTQIIKKIPILLEQLPHHYDRLLNNQCVQDKHLTVINLKLIITLTTRGVSRAGFLSGGSKNNLFAFPATGGHPHFMASGHLHPSSKQQVCISLTISDIFISGIPLATTRKGSPPLLPSKYWLYKSRA